MIGGTDIIIPVRDAQTALEVAIRAILWLWDLPVFENADTGETLTDYRKLVRSGVHEILVYRDATAQAGWKELGADPSLDGTMIHLIGVGRELTMAVDDVPSPSIRSFVATVRNALRKDLFASTAEPRRKVAA